MMQTRDILLRVSTSRVHVLASLCLVHDKRVFFSTDRNILLGLANGGEALEDYTMHEASIQHSTAPRKSSLFPNTVQKILYSFSVSKLSARP